MQALPVSSGKTGFALPHCPMPGRRVSQAKQTMPDSSAYSLHPATGNTQREIASPNPAGSRGKSRCPRGSAFQVGAGIRKTRSGPLTPERRPPKEQSPQQKESKSRISSSANLSSASSKTNPLLKSKPDKSCEKEWFMIGFSPCAKLAVFFHPALLFSGRFAVFPVRQIGFRLMRFPPFLPSVFQFDPCCMEHSFGIA